MTEADLTLTWNAGSILTYLQQHADELRHFGVRRLGLFGSYARDDQHAASDLDFLVSFQEFSFRRYARLWNFLEDSFNLKVDLVPEEDLRSELRGEILAEVRYVAGLYLP